MEIYIIFNVSMEKYLIMKVLNILFTFLFVIFIDYFFEITEY